MTSIPDILQKTVGLLNGGEVGRAAALCRFILVFEPAQPDALHLLGVLMRRAGRTADGRVLMARTLLLVPTHSGALLNHALTLLQLGRPDWAAAHFRRNLELEPASGISLSRLASEALACGRLAEAGRLLRRSATLETGRGEPPDWQRRALERRAMARALREDAEDPTLPPGLVVRGVFRDSSGYAFVVRRFVRGLVEAGIRVRLVDLNYAGTDNLPDDQIDPLLRTLDRPVRAKAVLTVTTPLAVEVVPGLKSINYTMFEALDIPPLWAAQSRRHDHVVVATGSSREAWLRAGHPPDRVHVSPAGVDAVEAGSIPPSAIVDGAGRRLSDYRVRLLNVSDLTDRKNLDGLLRVWIRTTRADDSAALLLKVGKTDGVSGRMRDLLARVSAQTGRTLTQVAPIFLVEGKLSDAEMMGLHAASTHYWSMSHGEGWDLPMAQAGAMGLTLLAPDHSAYRAYLAARVAHMIPSPVTPGITGYAGQDWWRPDEAEAARLLRAVIDDPDGTRRSAQAHLLEHFSWQAATSRLIDLLREIDAL